MPMPLEIEQSLQRGSDLQRTVDCEESVQRPLLTVVIPIYNEAATVAELLDSVIHEETHKEIILVDDGSSDGTIDTVNRWMNETCGPINSVEASDSRAPEANLRSTMEVSRTDCSDDVACFLPGHVDRIVLLLHDQNLGKGMAIRTALAEAKGDFSIIQDADLEVSPEAYASLLEPLVKGDADFVIGSRTVICGGRLMHRAGVGLLNLAVRILYRVRLTDEACCFKVLRTSDFLRMELACRSFEFCPEVVAKAIRLGLRIHEVPVSYNPRTVAEGKKLRLRDGLQALTTLLRYRFWEPVRPTTTAAEVSESSPADLVQKR